eukprot:360207-Chlamydomonas_euryale.AAC.3
MVAGARAHRWAKVLPRPAPPLDRAAGAKCRVSWRGPTIGPVGGSDCATLGVRDSPYPSGPDP